MITNRESDLTQKIKDIALKNWFEILLFTIYFIIILLFRLIISYGHALYYDGEKDLEFYFEMSMDFPSVFKKEFMAPFCYRILFPLIAYLSPLSPLSTFSLINFTSFFLMGILLYYTLRFHFSKVYSAAGLGFLCLFMISSTQFIMGPFYFGYIIDPLVYLFILCCFYAIVTSKKKMYALFLFFGVLTKESVLFTVPVFFLANIFREHDTLDFKQAFGSIYRNMKYILPTVFVIIALRLIIIPSPVQDHPWWYDYYQHNDYMSIGFIMVMIQKQLEEPLALIFGCTMFSWSVTFVFLFFNSKKNWSNWLKVYGVFMCCTYMQIIMGYHKPRLLLIAFYPMIVFSLLGFKGIIDYLTEQPKQGEVQFFKPLDIKLGE